MLRHSRSLVALAVLAVLAVLASPTILLAHGKGHVMGTVASVDATHLDVQTKEGKTVKVMLTEKTKYMRGGAQATSSDVKPGIKVSVHLADDGSAGEVHLPSADGGTR